MTLEQAAQKFIDHIKEEIVHPNKPPEKQRRSASAVTQYRHACRAFMTAVNTTGLQLKDLPATFLHNEWLKYAPDNSDGSKCKPVQLRQRAYAISNFIGWLQSQGVAVPPLHPVEVEVPVKAPALAEVPQSAGDSEPEADDDEFNAPPPDETEPAVEEVPRAEVPVAALPKISVPPPVSAPPPVIPATPDWQEVPAAPPPPPTPVRQPEREAPPARPAASKVLPMNPTSAVLPQAAPAAPQPRARQAAAPAAPPMPVNPLAGMLPQAGHKLRVWREKADENSINGIEEVWVNDFRADQVTVSGSIHAFLANRVLPKIVSKYPPRTEAVTFIVQTVAPDNTAASDRIPFTIDVPVQLDGPQNVQQGGQPAPQQIWDTIEVARRAQEAVVEDVVGRLRPQPAAPQPQQLGGLGSLGAPPAEGGVMTRLEQRLFGVIENLESRLDALEGGGRNQPQFGQPMFDPLALFDRMSDMVKSAQPAQPAQPVAQPLDPMAQMGMMFTMMEKARTIFSPSQVNIDTSPLEGQIEDLRQQLEAERSKKNADPILELATKVEAIKRVFGEGGVFGGSPRPPKGIKELLAEVAVTGFQNLDVALPILERVLHTSASAKLQEQAMRLQIAQIQAQRAGLPVPPVQVQVPALPPPPPAQPRATRPPVGTQAAMPPPSQTAENPNVPSQQLSAEEIAKITALLDAKTEAGQASAMFELMQCFEKNTTLAKVNRKVEEHLQNKSLVDLHTYLRGVFKLLGFEEKASVAAVESIIVATVKQLVKMKRLPEDMLALVERPDATDEEGDEGEGDEHEEGDDEDEGEEGDDEEEEGEDEDEDEEHEEEEKQPRARRAKPLGPPINIRVGGVAPMPVVEEAKNEEEPEEKPRKRRTRRRTKEEVAADRAREAAEAAAAAAGMPEVELGASGEAAAGSEGEALEPSGDAGEAAGAAPGTGGEGGEAGAGGPAAAPRQRKARGAKAKNRRGNARGGSQPRA